MKESKAIYVTKHKIREDQKLVYQLYAEHSREYYDKTNFGCQYDSKRDNIICTCRNIPRRQKDMRFFSGVPKQVYAYHETRSYTDIGVGSVKALQRRKVKRVYLPETDNRGVGSSDLSSFIDRRNRQQKGSYYDHKKRSSKCVGGIIEYLSVVSQKLSPIVQTRSGSTSPKMSIHQKNIEIGSNTIDKNLITTGTQIEVESKPEEPIIKEIAKTDRDTESPKKPVIIGQTQKYKYSTEIQGKPIYINEKRDKEIDKVYSSDSLVQHVHNLENPSDEKPSRASIDPMENQLEREYRRMFSTKDRDSKPSVDKPIPEFKSASILRRRFEALRRGIVKKDDGKKNNIPSSQDTVPSRIDVSVTSDPPSLEGRSFTDTKKYSPVLAHVEHHDNQINRKTKEEKDSVQWPQSDIDSECQGVKGMFNLWGKKFKFEDEAEKPKPKITPIASLAIDFNKKPQTVKTKKETENKKNGRKFFFFKKKSKDQKKEKPKEIEKKLYNSSGVTAGRCEIKDGLTLKLGGTTTPKVSKILEEGDEIQRKTWFKNFLTNTITSAKSVNVRWNNSMYATSSSTVFELMDTMYKNNGVVLKSRSEITSEESSYYRSYTKNKVNFDQKIEAWMIPNTIPDRPREIPVRILSNKEIKESNIGVTMSDQRWIIEKCKAFANKIEVVLHSKNFNRVANKVSSEYLRIDIPKDFFDASSSDDSKQNPTSDEEVYKIVEYESELNTKKTLDKRDDASEIKVIVSVQDSDNLQAKILETVIKKPPMHRDVVIQGSNVNIPKRCDVIGVGIITQRDMRDIRKPILKIQDNLTDDDSEEALQSNQKKCEFAESYLQEYYKHSWAPQGIDWFSWCVSDSHVRSCSEKSLISFHNQGDGSKSCPNIYEEYQTSAIISSCNTSSCSQCFEEVPQPVESSKMAALSSKISSTLKKCQQLINNKMPLKSKTDTDIAGKRFLPKDSIEVFKRRKIYAASLKSQWACSEDKPVSVPSIESKGAQDTLIECPKLDKSKCKPPPKPKVKKVLCNKHVSLLGCDMQNEILSEQLADQKIEGILAYKSQADGCKKDKCTKHAVVKPDPTCEYPQPPCKQSCVISEDPACNKPNSPTCNVPPGSQVSRAQPNKTCSIKSPCKPDLTCPASIPMCQRPSPLPQLQCRRKASPNILCPSLSPPLSPAISVSSSPKRSDDCLSSASNIQQKIKCAQESAPQRNDKRCRKCQHKLPCPQYPNCKLSSLESLKKSPVGSPQRSPQRSPQKKPCPCPVKTSPQKSPQSQSLQQPPQQTSQKSPCPCSPKSTAKPSPPGCSPPRSQQKSPQSSPGSSPPRSPNKLPPCNSSCSPQRSPNKSPTGSPCTPTTKNPHKKKTPKLSPCRLPPCKDLKKSIGGPPKPPCGDDQYPWPTNNQVSNPSSPSCSETDLYREQNKCKKKCPMLPKTSSQSLAPKKECKPDCANRKNKSQEPCPAKQPPPAEKTGNEVNKNKISGLFLKMKPLKKSCSKECLARETQDNERKVVKLNSRERITISMKKETPSTEEIRENMDIKVRDDDGNTLYERKDYTCNQSRHRHSLLNDMYKDSSVNRASTPITVLTNDVTTKHDKQEVTNLQSETSLANLIEIQMKLRITQGDKTTEISIAKEDDLLKQDKASDIVKTAPEVYVVENEAKERIKAIEEGPKNDISIKIIVKNYKPKSNKTKDNKMYDDVFSKKISDKFHTVSTGYSDNLTNQDDINSFSVHRATTNFDSEEKFKTLSKPSNEPSNLALSEELTEPINFMVSSHSTENIATDGTEDENIEKTISSKKDTQSYDKYDYTNELDAKDLDTDQDATLDNTSNECNDITYNSKEEKKERLKRVFEKAYNKPKNKETVRQLRDSLKIILTDSSDNDEINAASNELAKDVTYTSLKPDYFRNSDSMNNYYKMESFVTVEESKVTSSIRFPSGENNSSTSGGTSDNIKPSGCMCSRVAERLNCDLKIGCCCKKAKLDEITSCDIRNEDDIFLLNYRAEYVNVETQNSRSLTNKTNSMNLSIHSRENNNIQNETENISVDDRAANTTEELKETAKIKISKTFSSHKSHMKPCEMKKLNRTTVLGISDDDKIVLLSEEAVKKTKGRAQKSKRIKDNLKFFKASDVLQCYETKKAVLEIYAEKTVSENGEHFVANLPKFVYEKESEITRNYEKIATNSYKSVCHRNVFRMSVNG